ncbi:MAG: IclR family transcriptional regulator, acetate operon repressor [Kribbellaceae bacterium]|jgi:DNA-binding IclR family transcriptional regulator|nr:IclR family transcriptional regulator, acetate operon repressor [Kribbellaceae bacterium]
MSDEFHGAMTSVDKALQILVLLGETDGLRVIDVAEQLGVARSSAHRLLAALLNREFVVQDAQKVYRRGPAFARAGFGSYRLATLRVGLRMHLEGLRNRTGETTHLVVLEGNSARFIDGIKSNQVLCVGSRTGMLLPAYLTAAGKILLAEKSTADLYALYPFGLPGSVPGDANDLARRRELRRDLTHSRRRGYAVNHEQTERGVVAVAMALRDSHGRAHAAVAVACPSARCPLHRLDRLAAEIQQTVTAARPELDRYAGAEPEASTPSGVC